MKFSREELLFLIRASLAPWWTDPDGTQFSFPQRQELARRLGKTLKAMDKKNDPD